ncbi:hypothetical protein ACYULU_07410 [Breznakiellaceae bacterium SP9]
MGNGYRHTGKAFLISGGKALPTGSEELTLKKGSKSGVGQKGDWTASAFMGLVDGL